MNRELISPEQHQKDLERLEELSVIFPPFRHPNGRIGFNVMLNLQDDVTREEAIHDVVKTLGGLKAYIDNGHTLEGLPLEITETFGEITVYKTKDRS